MDDDGKYAGVGKLAAARGGRGPKAGTDKELVNALFRANGSVRAASPCSVRGKGPPPCRDLYIQMYVCVYMHIHTSHRVDIIAS